MRLILALKLTLDERRVPTVMQNNKSKDETKDKNNFFKSLFFYGFMGIFVGMFTFFPMNKMYVYTTLMSIFMFLILTVFISDFSSVLLDVRDNNLIATKGISGKTINAAKVTHICYYLFFMSVALCWLAIIGSFKTGILTGLIFLLEIVVIDVFMIVITAILYLLILKYFDGEKVKDIINFVQIALTIVMVVGYQLVGRVFNFVNLEVVFKEEFWNLLLPPMWFAAPIYLINGGKATAIMIILSALAVLVPIIAITFYIKNNTNFENYLSKLNASGGKEKEKRESLLFKLGYIVCRSDMEKAYYRFSSSLMKKEREFKLRVYPNLALTMIFPFIFILTNYSTSGNKNILDFIASLKDSKSYLFIYLLALMLPSIMMMLQYSSNYKGAWVFKTTPTHGMGNAYKGSYKAFIFNLLLPIYLCEGIIFTFVFGLKVIPSLIIALLYTTFTLPIFSRILGMAHPFSEEFKVDKGGKGIAVLFINIAIIALGAFINWLSTKINFGVWGYCLILLVMNYFVWNSRIFEKQKRSRKQREDNRKIRLLCRNELMVSVKLIILHNRIYNLIIIYTW